MTENYNMDPQGIVTDKEIEALSQLLQWQDSDIRRQWVIATRHNGFVVSLWIKDTEMDVLVSTEKEATLFGATNAALTDFHDVVSPEQ